MRLDARQRQASSDSTVKNQGSVALGYCFGEQKKEFRDSLRDLQIYNSLHGGILQYEIPIGGCYIEENRNEMVRRFRKHCGEDSNLQWLLSVDADIDFAPEMAYALYEQADPVKRPIMSGIYFSRLGEHGEIVPVWFVDKQNGKYSPPKELGGGMQEVDAVGMGFVLIHRSVFDKMAKVYASDSWTWFGRDTTYNVEDGTWHHLGEDLCFCRRAKNLGFRVWGHSAIQVGHIKATALSYEQWLREQHPEQLDKYEFHRGRVIGPKIKTNGLVETDGANVP